MPTWASQPARTSSGQDGRRVRTDGDGRGRSGVRTSRVLEMVMPTKIASECHGAVRTMSAFCYTGWLGSCLMRRGRWAAVVGVVATVAGGITWAASGDAPRVRTSEQRIQVV